MGTHRLLENLSHFSPDEASRIFGDAVALNPPNPNIELAPVERIALITESFLPKVDGVSKTAYLTLRYLQQTGREVIVFAPDTAPHSIHGTPIIPLPSLGFSAVPETRMALPHPMVTQALNAFKPDLIHMFSPALLSVSGMHIARQHRIPVIANYQTDLPAYFNHYGYPFLSGVVRDWLRYVHNGCHLTLAPSTWTMRQLQADGYRRLRRWGRGVNGELFHPKRHTDAMRARLLGGHDDGSMLCLYVGRLANEKRVDLLVKLAALPGVALAIVGDGALRPELEARFAGTNTHFTGYMYGDDLAAAYASADVFCFPSPTETFGQVVQEAMASGLPCIVGDQGGVTDLVQPGISGFHCPLDADAFAAAATQLRDDEDLRAHMAYEARAIAAANPWEVVLASLEGYYREALRLNARMNRVYRPQPHFLTEILNRAAERFPAALPNAESYYDRVS